MTCREKLLIDYPENSEERMNDTCPDDYGYASEPIYCTTLFSSGRECIDCWNREIEEKKVDERCEECPHNDDIYIEEIDGYICEGLIDYGYCVCAEREE